MVTFFKPRILQLAPPSYDPQKSAIDDLLEVNSKLEEFEKATRRLVDFPPSPRLEKIKPSHLTNLTEVDKAKQNSSHLLEEAELLRDKGQTHSEGNKPTAAPAA